MTNLCSLSKMYR